MGDHGLHSSRHLDIKALHGAGGRQVVELELEPNARVEKPLGSFLRRQAFLTTVGEADERCELEIGPEYRRPVDDSEHLVDGGELRCGKCCGERKDRQQGPSGDFNEFHGSIGCSCTRVDDSGPGPIFVLVIRRRQTGILGQSMPRDHHDGLESRVPMVQNGQARSGSAVVWSARR